MLMLVWLVDILGVLLGYIHIYIYIYIHSISFYIIFQGSSEKGTFSKACAFYERASFTSSFGSSGIFRIILIIFPDKYPYISMFFRDCPYVLGDMPIVARRGPPGPRPDLACCGHQGRLGLLGVEGSIGRPAAVDEFLGETPRKGKLSWLVVKCWLSVGNCWLMLVNVCHFSGWWLSKKNL